MVNINKTFLIILNNLLQNYYKVADKITKISTTPLHNTSETVKNETEYIELDRDMPRERYISSEKRKKIIDKLRLI